MVPAFAQAGSAPLKLGSRIFKSMKFRSIHETSRSSPLTAWSRKLSLVAPDD